MPENVFSTNQDYISRGTPSPPKASTIEVHSTLTNCSLALNDLGSAGMGQMDGKTESKVSLNIDLPVDRTISPIDKMGGVNDAGLSVKDLADNGTKTNVHRNEKCVIVQTRKNQQKQHFYSNNNQTNVTSNSTKTATTRQRKRQRQPSR